MIGQNYKSIVQYSFILEPWAITGFYY